MSNTQTESDTAVVWMTVPQILHYLQSHGFPISRATLYRWIELGMPSHQPLGRRVFIAAEVEDWIRSRCSPKVAGDKAVA